MEAGMLWHLIEVGYFVLHAKLPPFQSRHIFAVSIMILVCRQSILRADRDRVAHSLSRLFQHVLADSNHRSGYIGEDGDEGVSLAQNAKVVRRGVEGVVVLHRYCNHEDEVRRVARLRNLRRVVAHLRKHLQHLCLVHVHAVPPVYALYTAWAALARLGLVHLHVDVRHFILHVVSLITHLRVTVVGHVHGQVPFLHQIIQ